MRSHNNKQHIIIILLGVIILPWIGGGGLFHSVPLYNVLIREYIYRESEKIKYIIRRLLFKKKRRRRTKKIKKISREEKTTDNPSIIIIIIFFKYIINIIPHYCVEECVKQLSFFLSFLPSFLPSFLRFNFFFCPWIAFSLMVLMRSIYC